LIKYTGIRGAFFLNELNAVQQEAVIFNEGPSLVIAGAGSGKTRVLTYKIAYLLAQGLAPRSILALTFTNKAAAEMKERIAKISHPEIASRLWMGTFHSRFAAILRSEAQFLGYPSSFSIYDTSDSKNALKQVIKDLKLDDKIYKPGEILSRISKAKNNLITAGSYAMNEKLIAADKATNRPEIASIYRFYANRCKQSGAMDFDDILLNTNILFRDFPEVLEKYRNYFKFILVDEYQDTNFAQYLIIRQLSEIHRKLCVVGDDAQSIYAFRGAKIENILNFRKDYPDYRLFKLEQNYRSTQTIVNAANSLISRNKEQIPKKIFSENLEGSKIKLLEIYTDREEGAQVAKHITDATLKKQVHHKDIAILYRTNAQSRIFEESLRKSGIPYRIFGGLSFYQRKEVKDLLAYFRLVVNPMDDEAFRRIINYPARGIGKTTLTHLDEIAHSSGLSLWSILKKPEMLAEAYNKSTLAKLDSFIQLIEGFADGIDNRDAYQSAYTMAVETGILKDLYNDQSPEGLSRYENIQELLNSIKAFTLADGEDRNIPLSEYLQNVALLTDQDDKDGSQESKVSLMTIHAAKGLEFRYVFIVGMEENLFPSMRSVNDPNDLEEERRLFYVAITRAKEELIISHAKSRFSWGSLESCRPSRFIKEIDAQFVESSGNSRNPGDTGDSSRFAATPKVHTPFRKLSKLAAQPFAEPPVESDPTETSEIIPGMKVHHERFGEGKVLQVEGNSKATVFFAGAGQKQLLLKFAKLRIIN
jgi:DNA helicase II / ATP-dependent DNA helicase PcrA